MDMHTTTLGEMVENNVDIFDFDYPFYDEEKRNNFEKDFIEHFYFDEIGQETIARFKQRLKIKLNLIMPYWNKILEVDSLKQRILDNYDVTETYTRDIENNSNMKSDSTNKNLFSDTPITRTDLEQVDYYTNIGKNFSNGNTEGNSNAHETWRRTMKGNIGVQTDADSVVKYWKSLRKIEEEIFKECDSLFMGVF